MLRERVTCAGFPQLPLSRLDQRLLPLRRQRFPISEAAPASVGTRSVGAWGERARDVNAFVSARRSYDVHRRQDRHSAGRWHCCTRDLCSKWSSSISPPSVWVQEGNKNPEALVTSKGGPLRQRTASGWSRVFPVGTALAR